MDKQKARERDKILRSYRKEYERVMARIRDVGFICKGSLIERRLTCGNSNCGCHEDAGKLHGPYHQLSWKEHGKTVSHFLSAQDAQLYRQWIDNRRMLLEHIEELEVISRKAGNDIRGIDNSQGKAKKKRKRSTKNTT